MIIKRINRLLKNFLPPRVYAEIKNVFLKWNRSHLEEISETEFRDILVKKLGLAKGSVAFIHSSLDNVRFDFSFLKILSILKELVGEEGTLLFPATHFVERAEDFLKKEETFDVTKSPSRMGLLSELARRSKGACRSLHPTNSVVAIGKHAKELTGNHHRDIFPCGTKSPYFRIAEYNGIVIGIGVSTESLSFVHCVEDTKEYRFPIETRCHDVFNASVVNADGQIIHVKTLAAHPRIQFREIPSFMKRHISREIAEDLIIKGAHFFRADAKKLYSEMGKLAEKNITIYTQKAYKSN